MINVWPSGCVCQAVRAPGSNVTMAPATRAGSGAWNNGSIRTAPVNQSAGPLPDGCEPTRVIFMLPFLPFVDLAASLASAKAAKPVAAACTSLRGIAFAGFDGGRELQSRGSQQFVGRDRQFANALAGRVEDGVGDRRRDPDHRDLADAFHS